MPLLALTREVSPSIVRCELTHAVRQPIDVDLARAQHRAYERLLEEAGCTIVRVEPAPDLPDAVFVEDTAVVVDEVAVVTRPGAESRRAETAAVAEVLARYREIRAIEEPGTLDGGDVLVAGRRVFVGRSSRSNEAGAEQLHRILAEFGYSVQIVPVDGALHLKSAAAALADDRLLVNPRLVDAAAFAPLDVVAVHPTEPGGANIVRVGGELVYPDAFPRTREQLAALGYRPRTIDVGELAKAEGAVTCCSVIFGVGL